MTDLALATVSPAIAPARSPAAGMAGELVAHVVAELPALAALDDRDRLLAAAWLASLRSARTRRSYAGDLLGWRAWLAERGIELLGAGRVHVDLWVRAQQHAGAGDASVRRRLSGIGSFYRYCLAHDLASGDPTAGVVRRRACRAGADTAEIACPRRWGGAGWAGRWAAAGSPPPNASQLWELVRRLAEPDGAHCKAADTLEDARTLEWISTLSGHRERMRCLAARRPASAPPPRRG